MDQKQLSRHNQFAWEAAAYDAWVQKYGLPEEAGKIILARPETVLRRLLPDLGDPNGLKIANPLGSHGRIATALSVLGATVTVFDVSASNARYARELACAAGVKLDYVVGDFLSESSSYFQCFDATVMELGILHYFVSVEEFMASVRSITKSSGLVVLTDFHPISKKALTSCDGKPLLLGDYFSADFEEAETPYTDFLEEEIPNCLVRRWTMGEIVTAFARQFRISSLTEHPSWDYKQIPGTFTLVGRVA